MRPTTVPLYWFARGNGVLHTGVTEVGQVTDSGLTEFEHGSKDDVALKLDKYKDELPISKTLDTRPVRGFAVRDGSIIYNAN